MSLTRFADGEAALASGRREDGIRLIAEELEKDPVAPLLVYRNFCSLLFRHQRYAEGERWARQGTEQYPRDFDLWNLLGVCLRRLKRFDDALAALDRAQKINPKSDVSAINRGNIYNDIKNGPAAVAVWTKVVRGAPANAEHQRALGRAYWNSGDLEKAEMRFRLAARLKPSLTDAWLDLSNVVLERTGPDASLKVLDEGIAAATDGARLCEAKAALLRRLSRPKEAEAFLL